MRRLYIVINDEGKYVVNITRKEALEMKAKGWELYKLGFSEPKLVPGAICRIDVTYPLFDGNKNQVREKG